MVGGWCALIPGGEGIETAFSLKPHTSYALDNKTVLLSIVLSHSSKLSNLRDGENLPDW